MMGWMKCMQAWGPTVLTTTTAFRVPLIEVFPADQGPGLALALAWGQFNYLIGASQPRDVPNRW